MALNTTPVYGIPNSCFPSLLPWDKCPHPHLLSHVSNLSAYRRTISAPLAQTRSFYIVLPLSVNVTLFNCLGPQPNIFDSFLFLILTFSPLVKSVTSTFRSHLDSNSLFSLCCPKSRWLSSPPSSPPLVFQLLWKPLLWIPHPHSCSQHVPERSFSSLSEMFLFSNKIPPRLCPTSLRTKDKVLTRTVTPVHSICLLPTPRVCALAQLASGCRWNLLAHSYLSLCSSLCLGWASQPFRSLLKCLFLHQSVNPRLYFSSSFPLLA